VTLWSLIVNSFVNLAKKFGTSLLLTLLTAAIVLEIYAGLELHARLDKSRAASSDNRVWTISQIEVDHTNLKLALSDLKMQQGATCNNEMSIVAVQSLLSTAVDVFYSRVDVVANIFNTPETPEDLRTKLPVLVQGSHELADLFDISNLCDPVQLLAFRSAVNSTDDLVRSVVLGGLSHFVTEASTARDQGAKTTARFLAGSIVLLIIMGVSLCLSGLLHRRLVRQVSIIDAQNAHIRLVYDASMVAVVVTNSSGDIQMLNSAAERTFGYIEAEAKGRNIAEMMIPHHRLEKHRQEMKRYHDTGEGAFVNKGIKRTTSLRQDGTEIPVELSIRSEKDADGETMLIAFLRDISDQLTYEKNLQDARDEAQRHATAKTMFLATMSHEMRTPLHGLLASLDLVDSGNLDQKTQDLIRIARNCGLQTLHQINDVLELTRVGEVKERLSPYSPTKTVSKIIEELRPLAKDRGNQLSLNVTGAAEDGQWLGHPQMFARAIYNLVGNALKFTQNGSVVIDLDFDAQVDPDSRLCVSIKDTGVGISAEDQAKLFRPFFTVDRGLMGPKPNSTGLGLAIVQASVEKMGGMVTVESQPGVGSRFFFEIPLKSFVDDRTQSSPYSDTTPLSSLNLRCLVVDDNRVNLDLTGQMLRRLGCHVVTCDSGQNAVASTAEQFFDVLFMDLNMPGGISGTEAAQLIRAQEIAQASARSAVILALTADTTATVSTLAQGLFDEVLHKPVQIQELRKILGRFLSCETANTRPDDAVEETMSEALPDVFSDLFDLIGQEQGARLLDGVLGDIDAALNAIRFQNADAADQLHRAIGSTAAVGLLEFSEQLRWAEDLANVSAWHALSTLLPSLELNAHRTRECIKRTQTDIGGTSA
jgi:PAS domain S-box-containing protein